MKINNCQNYQIKNNVKNFKGKIPVETLKQLKKQNTFDSINKLNSCLGFNAMYDGLQNIDPERISYDLLKKYNIGSDFRKNPLIAAISALTVNIFKKLNFPLPSNIFYLDFPDRYYNAHGLCVTHPYDASIYNKFKRNFPLHTVMLNSNQNWDSIQDFMLQIKSDNNWSTGHFLAVPIHEFMHSLHLYRLRERFGQYASPVFIQMQSNFTNESTIAMLRKETSNYGATQPVEMFAEEMTELVVNSLDPKTILPDPKLFYANRKAEPAMMDKLIDACWNGDLNQVQAFKDKMKSVEKSK